MTTEANNQPPASAGRKSVPINQRVEDTIVLMEDLTDLLDEETSALANRDFAAFSSLQADKVELSSEYQSMIGRLRKRQAEVAKLPDDLRTHLREAALRLEQSMGDNERAVDVARRGTRAVIDTIIDAARRAVAPNDAYTETAEVPKPDRKNSAAVSLNEEL
jgi:hypothetical protein